MFTLEERIDTLSRKASAHCDLPAGVDLRPVVRFLMETMAVDSLSQRESQVFKLLGRGYTTREIAAQLNIQIKTVDAFRESIKRKLNLANANQLVQKAAVHSVGQNSK